MNSTLNPQRRSLSPAGAHLVLVRPMQRPNLCIAFIALVLLLPSADKALAQEPRVIYTMNVAHPEQSPKYDKRDIARIIRLARRAAPDQRRVQQIDFASAHKAEVRTGQRSPDDDQSPDHGQMLYVGKARGVWKVTGRAKWIYAGNGRLFEVKPQ
ncbi:MAG TPA: hypothetical protein VM940_08965 [Chthoniobacterales bacterium]|nr:hypothetical protein [Chthoniobacterales bacterium]